MYLHITPRQNGVKNGVVNGVEISYKTILQKKPIQHFIKNNYKIKHRKFSRRL